MDYKTASEKLTGRNAQRRKLGNNTYLERRDADTIAVRLHDTDVLVFHSDGSTVLNSGGWRTVTTKDRINGYIEHGYYIGQRKGQWFVSSYSNHEPIAMYADGMTIDAKGKLSGTESLKTEKKLSTLRKRVQKFAKEYIEAFKLGNVPAPSLGDCFYCAMREVNTHKPLGECTKNTDHILSHLEENYFVPSLLQRAFETMPHSKVMEWAIAERWNPEAKDKTANTFQSMFGGTDSFVFSQLQKMLSRYMLRQIGQAS